VGRDGVRRRTRAVARAFAPGHVSAIFRAELGARDPRGRGSLGAGFVLDRGVHARAEWRPHGPDRVRVRGGGRSGWPISTDVATRLKADRRGELIVELRHELPVGQGFGMSAAGALATALAVARVLGLPAQRATQTAHLGELFGGGGLGGVAAILGGGLELRERPGVPPWGQVRHRLGDARFLAVELGPPVPSPRLLRDADFLDRVGRAAGSALRRIRRSFTTRTILGEGDRFRRSLGIALPSVERSRALLAARGALGLQALFGRSLLVAVSSSARARTIERYCRRRGWRCWQVRLAERGAEVTPSTALRGTRDRPTSAGRRRRQSF
jgi:pantoate kinase